MSTDLQSIPPDADPATAAFARLTEEVGVVRRLIAANDQNATLGEILQRLDTLVGATQVLSRRPAMALTPDAMAEKISEAAQKARAADHAAIGQAKERIDKAAGLIEAQTGKIATIRQQRRRLAWMGGGGLITGVLLWSFLPGAILRAMPVGWGMPERMAAHIVGEPNLWEAGSRMMRVDNPHAWHVLADAATMQRANQDAITACEQAAGKARKPVQCEIKVAPRPE